MCKDGGMSDKDTIITACYADINIIQADQLELMRERLQLETELHQLQQLSGPIVVAAFFLLLATVIPTVMVVAGVALVLAVKFVRWMKGL